MTFCKF